MAILDSVGKLIANFSGIVHTRLELVAVEIEEELSRFSSILLWSLTALFCACCAVVLIVVLLIAVFWDTHRIELISGLIAVFAVAAAGITWWIHQQLQVKPRLLSLTLSELEKDGQALRDKFPHSTPN